MTTYRCCRHCEPPCPANGHSKPCRECDGRGTGRKIAEARHFPPGTTTAQAERDMPWKVTW